MIELTEVTKTFPGTAKPAVDRLTLRIAEGEVVVLVGPSGCGKTTTLKMINRLIEPSGGTITVDGRDVLGLQAHELRRGIGYVIQQIGLFPHKTIGDNIATVPNLLGWDKGRTRARVEELVDLVELPVEMLDRYPGELSGGQRQRVGVARALAADPPVLLMDEPFGAVDPIVRANLQDELLSLQSQLRKTIVLVTHDIDEAIKLGDRVAILSEGGHLEQYAPPSQILSDPANPFVADFLGSDRGIKRLSLIPISAIQLDPGPVLPRQATKGEAVEMMARYGIDWAAIGQGNELEGWFTADDLAGHDTLENINTRDYQVRLSPEDSLREALDAVITSHTAVAAVFDGNRYLGMATVDEISREIVQ
ncbi:MAG: ABC transporter ATP-binding protein [Acidimicrobiia bacterium]|nr:ABC transporter ATP-binding protein [Acidimicrobiia bacterium]